MACCTSLTPPTEPGQPAQGIGRRDALQGLAGSAVLAGLAGSAQAQGAAGRIRLAFCGQLLCVVPYEVTRARGHFRNEGLEVELVYTRGGNQAMQALVDYDWPGNVRQLEHTIERAVIVARGGIITSHHLNLEAAAELAIVDVNQKLQANQSLPEVLAEVERLMVSRALERTSGNRYHAAKMLGIDIASFEKKLDEHGLGG